MAGPLYLGWGAQGSARFRKFTRGAITNVRKLSGLNIRNVLSHSSGARKSEIKVSAGPCSL